MKESILKTKSFVYAVDCVNQYKKLLSKNEYILSKQFLRSSTSVGANISEANNAQSLADFIHKLNISQKECGESIFWLELMFHTEFINEAEFRKLHSDATEILRMLKSSINTSRNKSKN
ncbi:MAG: four helix bundle protein [Flavobacteriia bacterium]|jgi:four helix bundle protein